MFRNYIDGDNAAAGISALDILRGRFSAFLFPYHYIGTLESFFIAGFMTIFGKGIIAVRFAPYFHSLLFIITVYVLGSKIYNVKVGLLSMMFVSIPPVILSLWSVSAVGSRQLIITLGSFVLIGTCGIMHGPCKSRLKYVLLYGLAAGLGFWTNFQILYYILPTVPFLILGLGKKLFRKEGLLLLLAFFAGSLPFWVYNIKHSFLSFSIMRGGWHFSLKPLCSFIGKCSRMFGSEICPDKGWIWMITGGILLLSVIWVVVSERKKYGKLFRLSFREAAGSEILLALLVAITVIFTGSYYAHGERSYKYLLPLFSALPIFLARWITILPKPVGITLFSILMAFNLYTNLQPEVYKPLTGSGVRLFHSSRVSGLDKKLPQVGVGSAHMGCSYNAMALSFMSGEKTVGAKQVDACHPLYELRVDADFSPAMICGSDKMEDKLKKGLCAKYKKETAGHFFVFYDIHPLYSSDKEIPRAGWKIVSTGGENSGSMMDGNLFSYFRSGCACNIIIDLGDVCTVSKVSLVPWMCKGLPGIWQIAVSEDGETWKEAMLPVEGTETFFWTGSYVKGITRRGHLDGVFAPMDARYVKIHLVPQSGRELKVNEMFIYGPGKSIPVSEHDGLTDIVGFLRSKNVRHVYSGIQASARVTLMGDGRILGLARLNRFYPDSEHSSAVIDFSDDSAIVVPSIGAPQVFSVLKEQGVSVSGNISSGRYTALYGMKRTLPVLRKVPGDRWNAKANYRSGDVMLALDNDIETRWGTGHPQCPGMCFEVDFGEVVEIAGLNVKLGKYRTDFPRSLNILFSKDGNEWFSHRGCGRIFETLIFYANHVLGFDPAEKYYFREPFSARYMKLCQEGTDTMFDWSIAELEVFSRNNPSDNYMSF